MRGDTRGIEGSKDKKRGLRGPYLGTGGPRGREEGKEPEKCRKALEDLGVRLILVVQVQFGYKL